jgi:hypothetical protein
VDARLDQRRSCVAPAFECCASFTVARQAFRICTSHMVLVLDGNMNVVRRSQAFSFEGSPIKFSRGLDVDVSQDTAIVA